LQLTLQILLQHKNYDSLKNGKSLTMVHTVYDKVANFMATMNPQKVITFKPSEANQNRFEDLLYKQKQDSLSGDEKREIEHYLMLNRIIGLAKAQALKLI
jgi:hypothetical protein